MSTKNVPTSDKELIDTIKKIQNIHAEENYNKLVEEVKENPDNKLYYNLFIARGAQDRYITDIPKVTKWK